MRAHAFKNVPYVIKIKHCTRTSCLDAQSGGTLPSSIIQMDEGKLKKSAQGGGGEVKAEVVPVKD